MSNEGPTFELGVYDERGDHTLLLGSLLESGRDLSWYQDDDSVLVLRDGKREHLREEWNFGQLSRIVPQLQHVREALAEGRVGILRSAVLDEHHPPYLRFEPTDEGRTIVSRFIVKDKALRFHFPDQPGGDAIYALFDADASPSLKRVAVVETDPLVQALGDAIAAGTEFLAKTGRVL